MFEEDEPGAGVLHVVAFRWIDGTPPAASHALKGELQRMAANIPAVVSYRCGPDLAVLPGSWDFAVVAAVRSADDLRAYLGDPVHAAITRTRVVPMLAERVAVQIGLDDADSILTHA